MVASRSGWPGQMNSARGLPGTLISSFSNVRRSYRVRTGSRMPMSRSRLRMTAGTWVASSYLWASVGDWARMGQMMMDDGKWKGQQVIPAGFLKLAKTSALPEGEGAGYGAQTWIPAQPVGGECKGTPGLPEDTVSMEGHWGQVVAMVPSRRAVIVRLGWTFNGEDAFKGCEFVSDVLKTLAP